MPLDDSNTIVPIDQPIEVSAETLVICTFDQCTITDVKLCRKCKRAFCIMHANRFSPNFCKDCFKNLSVLEDKFKRTTEDFDTKTDKLIIKSESCTVYRMDGIDWPFFNPWIASLSDDELSELWNFHYFIMKSIETENDNRVIKKNARIRNAPPVKLVKTTKTTSTIKPADTKEDVIKKLKKQGLPQNIIDMMVASMP